MSRAVPDHWLLLRGLGREVAHWHSFPQQLTESLGLDEGAVLCLDLPGSGDQSTAPAPWTVAGTAAAVRRCWLEHARQGVWGLLGISLGGMVAIDWAGRWPDDFVRVVTINPSERSTCCWCRRLRWRALPLMLRIAMTRDVARREDLIFELTTRRLGQDRAGLLAERVKIERRRPTRPATVLRQLVAAARWSLPASVPIPVLMLVSLGDSMVDPVCGQRLAARLATVPALHPWGGHELPLDDPAWICDQLGA